MARSNTSQQNTEVAPEPRDFTDGVSLYDRSGQEYRVYSQREHTTLVFGHGYSEEKPQDPEPEVEVPPPPPLA